MTIKEINTGLKARFIAARDSGQPATIGLIEVMEILEGLANETLDDPDAELYKALDIILDELTDRNAHTVARLLEAHYRTGYDMDKVDRAYKAAQWELFGTR